MRSPIRFVALTAAFALATSLLPVDVSAQHRGGGGGRGGGASRGGAVRAPQGHAPSGGRPVASPRGSGSYRAPYYRGGARPAPYNRGAYYGSSRYGYRNYGYGHYGYGSRYYRPYYYYGGYRYPYWGWGASFGWSPYWAPYWGAYYYGYGYPYYWGGYGGYWGGYYRSYDPNSALGAARLQVSPRETEVFVDGYFAGVVDDFDGFSQRLRLEPGEHEVTLFLEGHRPLTRRMLFTVGQTFKLQHEMEPLGAGEPAPQRPVPTAKPPAPARTRYNRPGTQGPGPGRPGDMTVSDPSAPAARDSDIEVIEAPSDPGPRTARPTPPDEARGPSGTLAIRVQPDDAEVVIDGEPWARSGGERLVVALAPGVHRLEVRKNGHETYTGLVRIRPGVATTLNVALATADAR